MKIRPEAVELPRPESVAQQPFFNLTSLIGGSRTLVFGFGFLSVQHPMLMGISLHSSLILLPLELLHLPI